MTEVLIWIGRYPGNGYNSTASEKSRSNTTSLNSVGDAANTAIKRETEVLYDFAYLGEKDHGHTKQRSRVRTPKNGRKHFRVKEIDKQACGVRQNFINETEVANKIGKGWFVLTIK